MHLLVTASVPRKGVLVIWDVKVLANQLLLQVHKSTGRKD